MAICLHKKKKFPRRLFELRGVVWVEKEKRKKRGMCFGEDDVISDRLAWYFDWLILPCFLFFIHISFCLCMPMRDIMCFFCFVTSCAHSLKISQKTMNELKKSLVRLARAWLPHPFSRVNLMIASCVNSWIVRKEWEKRGTDDWKEGAKRRERRGGKERALTQSQSRTTIKQKNKNHKHKQILPCFHFLLLSQITKKKSKKRREKINNRIL